MYRLEPIRQALDAADSFKALEAGILEIISPFGFFAFTIGIGPLFKGQIDSSRAVLHTTLPQHYLDEYHEQSMEAIDPVFELMAYRYLPYTKSSIEELFDVAPAKKKIMDLADEYEVGDALMIPVSTVDRIRGVVLFTNESADQFARRVETDGPLLHQMAFHIMARAEQLGFSVKPPVEAEQVGLSEREADCLAWCARGKTLEETAADLGISERTVRFHVNNACQKLGADRRSLAITRAVQLGLVRL